MDMDDIRRENDEAEANLRQDVIEGEQIETMTKTAGWKMFEENMMDNLKGQGALLQTCNDEKEIYRAQGAMKMLNALIRYSQIKIDAGKEAKQELEGGK